MRYRSSKLDMAHSFAANLRAGDFHSASVADYAFIAHPFVFSAMAFPVFLRSKNTLAE
ncbi:Uncharacterised protein [Mycobacteroides abscessus subsp. abscessus]|nr:Uncharacterised protein [Mycobacteroides abscessus subsp. abscessus]